MNHGTDKILKELLDKQSEGIPYGKKLQYFDMLRISRHITTSIFDDNECCIWNGYISNVNHTEKCMYINFYFKGKKVALHRLLYINFIGQLDDDEYLKLICKNKGICCNVNHLKKKTRHKNSKDDNKIIAATINNINNDDKHSIKLSLSFD